MIAEGPRATVADVIFSLGDKPVVTEAELRSVLAVRKGAPYVRTRVQAEADAMLAYYNSRGFQPEEFHVDVTFNEALTEATVTATDP